MRAHDVSVRDAAREPNLPLEPLQETIVRLEGLRFERLDGNLFVQLSIVSPVDYSHAARADHFLDFVSAGEQ